MTWSSPETRQTGDLITAAIWNQDVVDNSLYLHERGMGPADYDSGWFAVTYGQTYTKAHGLGETPRLFWVLHSTSASGASEWVPVTFVGDGGGDRPGWGADATNVYAQTGSNSSVGVVRSLRRNVASGYYRILAWK